MIKSLIISNFLILLLITVFFAQQNKYLPPGQIAFYNKYKFEDSQTGIKRYVKALDSLGYIDIFESDPEKRKAQYDAAVARKWKYIINPVVTEINDLLKEIAEQNNLVLLDITELDKNSQLLAFDEKLDISDKIIAVINKYFETKTKPEVKPDLPETKIGLSNKWKIKYSISI